MAQQQRQAPRVKEDPYDHHSQHPQQQHQGPAPHLQQPLSRPPSIVHQHSQTPPQTQQPPPYAPVYSQQPQTSSGPHTQSIYDYQSSPYSTPAPTGGYTSADMMAATMSRPPYPPMSYHTPQSNSPASVGSAPGHDQQRSIYGQPPPQIHQQSMYYSQQPQYQPLPPASASPYGQHAAPPHQSMASQPNMMMSHGAPSPVQHQMSQHGPAPGMAGSPRHAKMELQNLTPQLPRQPPTPAAPSPLSMSQMQAPGMQGPGMASHQAQGMSQGMAHQQHGHGGPHGPQQNGTGQLPTSQAGGSVVNPNAAPGPIPATTPLVVRQDQNGVQWIAFEYSRDRVKMEYTIRCDVESVMTDDLSPEFKQENCVYPRACCPREQYRGNRLQYESECNTVGWALAQLNPPLRGKRGLIQRAVDSWRNSNQDPRLRSRRVRRMAKMGTRKAVAAQAAGQGMAQAPPVHMGQVTLPSAAAPMGKPMPILPPQMHHHDGNGHGDEVGQSYSPHASEPRPAHVFSSYGGYGSGTPTPLPALTSPVAMARSAGGTGFATTKKTVPQPDGLFPDLAEAQKRKFVLVEDRGSRLRVRVTLNAVDTSEIPDSFRRSNAVYPGSFFPIEMESPPPSPMGRRFFPDDDGGDEVEASPSGRRYGGRPHTRTTTVSAPVDDGVEAEVEIPRMRTGMRRKQVRLNDLGCRMAWLQSRAFAGRRIFLQKALDTYRSKTCNSIQGAMRDVADVAPHYEMRLGKKRWLSCEREMEARQVGRM